MAWYYEDSILPIASWLTYLLEIKCRKENILFVYSILFIHVLVSTSLAQFMSQTDGAGQRQLSSRTDVADPVWGQSDQGPEPKPRSGSGSHQPVCEAESLGDHWEDRSCLFVSYLFSIDCPSKKGNWFRGLKMFRIDYKGDKMRLVWRAQCHPPFSNLAETFEFWSVPGKEIQSAIRDKLPEVCFRKLRPQLFSFSLPAPRSHQPHKMLKMEFLLTALENFSRSQFLRTF